MRKITVISDTNEHHFNELVITILLHKVNEMRMKVKELNRQESEGMIISGKRLLRSLLLGHSTHSFTNCFIHHTIGHVSFSTQEFNNLFILTQLIQTQSCPILPHIANITNCQPKVCPICLKKSLITIHFFLLLISCKVFSPGKSFHIL